MGEVINLRRVRKALARTAAETRAAANRVAHGRTRAEKAAADAAGTRLARELDGAKIDR